MPPPVAMTAVGFCGCWMLFSCGTKLVAIHTRQNREPFVFDCSAAERKPKPPQADVCVGSDGVPSEETGNGGPSEETGNGGPLEETGSGGPSEETGSDTVLAFAASPSGRRVAVTDDSKRLVLLESEPSWRCISTRWVARRCTSLTFSQSEDELLVADKSGDVYSFSVEQPQAGGQLRMGHLSMLLAVAVSPDDRFVITADRDEKIRVSHRRSPHNIQAFCLGHEQFVSVLQIPAGRPDWLLSGSGDGTVKLWEYESGRRLQSLDVRPLGHTPGCHADKDQNATVCRISCSPDGLHVAVQSERVQTVQIFRLEAEGGGTLAPHSRLSLPHPPLDLSFHRDGRLWVLLDHADAPVHIYRLHQDAWGNDTEEPELCRVNEAVRTHWTTLQESWRGGSRFEHLSKTSYDNVTTYLQKKQQRLEEQKKRTKTREENGNKRRKKETSGGGT